MPIIKAQKQKSQQNKFTDHVALTYQLKVLTAKNLSAQLIRQNLIVIILLSSYNAT